MGSIPRTQFTHAMEFANLQKEAEQLQVANNELTAELTRIKERERLRVTKAPEAELAKEIEDAEDSLWSEQGSLKMEKTYTKGFASLAMLATPATAGLFWLGATSESHLVMSLVVVFGLALGFTSLISIAVVFVKIFGEIPETKRRVEKHKRTLDRALLKELGIK